MLKFKYDNMLIIVELEGIFSRIVHLEQPFGRVLQAKAMIFAFDSLSNLGIMGGVSLFLRIMIEKKFIAHIVHGLNRYLHIF